MLGKILFSLICFQVQSLQVNSLNVTIKAITPPIEHSEGPVWHVRHNALYYVDAFKATAYQYTEPNNVAKIAQIKNHNSIGVIIPVKGTNEFVVTSDYNIFLLVPTDSLIQLAAVSYLDPDTQFNDGKIDCKGRLWTGTLKRRSDRSVKPHQGAFYLFDGRKVVPGKSELKAILKINKTSISNGLTWSTDNKRFYYIDSEPKTITLYDFHEETGQISNGRVFFDLNHHPQLKGIPDGMTSDINNNLWVALYGGGAVLHIDGKTGDLLDVIKLPVTYVTSVAFGTESFTTLFVTTSQMLLDEKERKKEPLAGSVLALTNLNVRGVPPFEYIKG